MAEIDYMEDHDRRDGAASGFGKWVNLSGAVMSLVLIGGLSVWGYQLLMRDVNGVPVVQAMEGAFRVAPEDPGGMQAPHQGLSVNEIAADSEASGPVEEVTLAPPPAELEEEDETSETLERIAAAEAAEEREAARAAEEREAARAAEEQRAAQVVAPEPEAPEDVTLAEADGIEDGEEDTASTVIEDAPSGALATDMAVAQALANTEDETFDDAQVSVETADAASLRPEPRPARAAIVNASAERSQPAAEATTGGEVDVAELATGTRLVQLGAFASGDVARAEWERIVGRFPDYFDGKRRVVQKADSGGKTFYRLRAEGFTDLADTRRFCTELLAQQTDCIPVELQ